MPAAGPIDPAEAGFSLSRRSAPSAGTWILPVVLLVALAAVEIRMGGRIPFTGIAAGLIVFAGLCLARLEAAFLLLIAITPWSVETVLRGTGSALQIPTEPMLFLALAAWSLRFLSRGSSRFGQPAFMLALLLALAACLLSIVDTPFRVNAIKATINAAWYALFGVFILNNFGRRRDAIALVSALIVPAVALTLYSLAHVATGHYYAWAGYWWGFPFFTEHGSFAAYLSFACALSLALTLELRGPAKLLVGAAALLTGAQVVLSLTRGAWLGLGVMALFFLFVSGKRLLRPGNLVLGAAGLVLLGAIVLSIGSGKQIEAHSGTITEVGYESNFERLNRWYAGWRMFQSDPLTGVGFGTYSDHYLNFRRVTLSTSQSDMRMGVHSEYLRVLCETGLIGLAAAAFAFLLLARLTARAIRGARDPVLRGIAVGLAGGLITYLVHGVVNNYLVFDKVAIPVWASIGLLGALARNDDA